MNGNTIGVTARSLKEQFSGPKVLDFYSGFCAHREMRLKADGKAMLSVTIVPNPESAHAESGDLL
jgi:hypothetical protein